MPSPFQHASPDLLRRRTSAKWQRYEPDVLPLWVAEMDVDLPDAVVAAIRDAVERGDTGYPSGDGYARAFAAFAAERWGWHDLAVERTVNVADVMRGIDEVLDVLSSRADAVVVNCPVYPPFYDHVRHSGRRLVEAPLGPDGRLDLTTLATAFAEAARVGPRPAFLLCSPHNPTGTVHTSTELAAVAELAAQHGVRVLVDEIHAPLVLPGATFVPYLTVPGGAAGFSIMSASKAWNLAGIKAAVVVAGPDAVDDLARIPTWAAYGASHLGVIAHTAALRDGGGWLDALLEALDANRHLLGDLLAEHLPGVRGRAPEGTYLAWLDCRALGLGEDPAERFLADGRVALNAGPTFGTGGAGHVRLNFATSAEILTEALRRMAGVAVRPELRPSARATAGGAGGPRGRR